MRYHTSDLSSSEFNLDGVKTTGYCGETSLKQLLHVDSDNGAKKRGQLQHQVYKRLVESVSQKDGAENEGVHNNTDNDHNDSDSTQHIVKITIEIFLP